MWSGPSYEEKELTKDEAKSLIRTSGSLMLRNIYDWDFSEKTGFWEIIRDSPITIDQLSTKKRNQVRKSLKNCLIRKITGTELVEAGGYRVYSEAFKRYKKVTVTITSEDTWKKMILNSHNLEYWGVFDRGDALTLIAYAQNQVLGLGVNFRVLKAHPDYMNKNYPFYGLIYEMIRYYLQERHYRYVTDGFRSITEHSNIQPFLEETFGFRKAYCNMRMFYKPWFGIVVRFLYPLRKWIPILKVKNLLKMEELSTNRL